MAEITSPDYPAMLGGFGKNPLLAEERDRKRAELLAVTEKELARIAARVQRLRAVRCAAPRRYGPGGRRGAGAAPHGQAFPHQHHRRYLQLRPNPPDIVAEAALDGIYVVRTNLPATQSDAAATVRAYKNLSSVEHAFRSLKTVHLALCPVFHWTAPRVRAHVLLCMLAYYLQWHMRRSLAPMLFDEPDTACGARHSAPHRWPRPSPHRRRNARPPANAPGQ